MIGVLVFAAILAMPLFRTRTRYIADLVAPRPPQTAFLPTGGSSGSQARAVVPKPNVGVLYHKPSTALLRPVTT